MNVSKLDEYGINGRVIEEYIEKANKGEFLVAVLGEFSSGKSTFINAYLNKRGLLPDSNVECTPVLIDIIKAKEEKMYLKFNEGRSKDLGLTVENLNRYAVHDKENYDRNIVSIHITLDNENLEEGYHLIDTPGMNTLHEEHEVITRGILRKADIVLYAINKSVTEVDLEKIKEITRYTEDIIFIVTHMDKKVDGSFIDRDLDEIESFVKEAEERLAEAGHSSIVLPIGSYSAYNDRSMINEIQGIIHNVIKESSEKQFKNRIKNQMRIVFENRIKELKDDYMLTKNISNIEKDKLENDIKKIEKKVNKALLDENYNSEKLEEQAIALKESLNKSINNLYKQARLNANKIISEDIENLDQYRIKKIIENFESEVNRSFKKAIEEEIQGIVVRSYNEINGRLKDIYSDIEIKIEAKIEVPTIEQIDVENDIEIIKIRDKREQREREKAILQDELNAREVEKENASFKLDEIKNDINEVSSRITRNEYIPEYDIDEEASGSDMGGKVGRIIGEVIDMALFIWAPQGAVLKVADKLKDTGKGISYVAKAVSKVKEEDKELKIMGVLDLLSAGGIGEKVGEKLGGRIKPYKKITTENLEHKRLWEQSMKIIKDEKRELEVAKREIQKRVENEEMSVLQRRGALNKIERENKKLKEKEERLLIEKIKQEELNCNEKIIKHYNKILEEIIDNEMKKTVVIASEIINRVKDVIKEKSERDFQNKIEKTKHNIEIINSNKEELDKEIMIKEKMIEKLKRCDEWIEEWI